MSGLLGGTGGDSGQWLFTNRAHAFRYFHSPTVGPVLFSEHQPCPFSALFSAISHRARRGASSRTAPPGDGRPAWHLACAEGAGSARQGQGLGEVSSWVLAAQPPPGGGLPVCPVPIPQVQNAPPLSQLSLIIFSAPPRLPRLHHGPKAEKRSGGSPAAAGDRKHLVPEHCVPAGVQSDA